jgi:hypothetical protein
MEPLRMEAGFQLTNALAGSMLPELSCSCIARAVMAPDSSFALPVYATLGLQACNCTKVSSPAIRRGSTICFTLPSAVAMSQFKSCVVVGVA